LKIYAVKALGSLIHSAHDESAMFASAMLPILVAAAQLPEAEDLLKWVM
jgi:hypothetical protein